MLIVPGSVGWQFCADNLTATPPTLGTAAGTAFTTGGGNADGSAVTVLSALGADVQRLVLAIGTDGTAGEDNSVLANLLVDPAGGTSWTTLAQLIAGSAVISPNGLATHLYDFPLFLRAGTSIGMSARKNGATGITGAVAAWVFGRPRRPDLVWCGVGIESLGVVAASSKGTAHTPGASGAFSAFASLGSSTRRYGAIQVGIQSDGNAINGRTYHCQLGIGGVKLPGSPTMFVATDTNERGLRTVPGAILCDLPAGTAIQYRATSSGTANNQNVAAYGVY